MFPQGIAGVALLLLRLVCLIPLVLPSGLQRLSTEPTATDLGAICLALLLLFGALTPIVCSLIILVGLLALRGTEGPAILPFISHLATTASLMMLGPGAYSIDARLFGRRLIVPPEV